MKALTDKDRKTIRFAAIGVAVYLVLFYGWKTWRSLEEDRRTYARLVTEAQTLRVEFQRYENKLLLREKLQGRFGMDPAKLKRETVLNEVSAAIQKAAQGGGVQIGPVRETTGSGSGRELASMRLEGTGPVPSILGLLHRLEHLGFPLVVDSIQLDADPRRPDQLKITMNIVILDFEQWRKDKRHA